MPRLAVRFIESREREVFLVPQVRVVALHNSRPGGCQRVDAAELAAPECRREVRQVVLETERTDVVLPAAARVVAIPGVFAHAVQREDAYPFAQLLVVGREGSA